MKGLIEIPSISQMGIAYEQLQTAQQILKTEKLVQYSEWSRFDPRLAEQLVKHLVSYWKEIPLFEVRLLLQQSTWPATFGVLLEHGLMHLALPKKEHPSYRLFMRAIVADIPPAMNEAFFIGTRSFSGKEMRLDAELSHKIYLKWGFFSRENLIHTGRNRQTTTLSLSQRKAILQDLIHICRSNNQPITVNSYREALSHQVGVRQAELDLRSHPQLQAKGRTRSRTYWVQRARKKSNQKI